MREIYSNFISKYLIIWVSKNCASSSMSSFYYLFWILFFSFASSFWIIWEEGEDGACASFLNYDLHLVLNGSGFNDIHKNVYEWQTNLTSFCIGERSNLCTYICLHVKIKKEMSLNINIHPFVAHKKRYLCIIKVWMWDWRVRCTLKMYMYLFSKFIHGLYWYLIAFWKCPHNIIYHGLYPYGRCVLSFNICKHESSYQSCSY